MESVAVALNQVHIVAEKLRKRCAMWHECRKNSARCGRERHISMHCVAARNRHEVPSGDGVAVLEVEFFCRFFEPFWYRVDIWFDADLVNTAFVVINLPYGLFDRLWFVP